MRVLHATQHTATVLNKVDTKMPTCPCCCRAPVWWFYLPARCYLVQRQRAEQLGRSVPGFTRWVEDRRELIHLLNHANLNT